MHKTFVMSAAILAMTVGIATAQTTSSQTTTTVAPSVMAPPAATQSVTRSSRAMNPDGTQTNSTERTYRNSDGATDERATTTTTYPPGQVTTTTKSRTSVGE